MESSFHATHILESVLLGELDFLDGVVATNREQETVRLWDVWKHLGKTPFTHIVSVPHKDDERAVGRMAEEIANLVIALEEFGGVRIDQKALWNSISVYNRMRVLLRTLYDLRKRTVPPVTGAEALGIVSSATIMPKEEFNQELEALLPYLKGRTAFPANPGPRILVSSDELDHPGYIQLVEEAGGVVAMDDNVPGSRYFWGLVDTSLSDPVYALAQRYLSQPAHPRMFAWDKQVEQVIDWVDEFNIHGVIKLAEVYSYPRLMRVPYFQAKLKERGIPCITLEREYRLANVGQLTTRVEAFVEMLKRE